MRQIIRANENELKRVFSDDFLFSIPSYQRPYAWTHEEAGALLSDLLDALGDGNEALDEVAPYFLGSVVLIKDEAKPEADVVDGQQRLTTLTILLAVIRDLLDDPKSADSLHQRICQLGDPIANIPDRFRLNLRERDRAAFRTMVQTKGATAALDGDPGALTDSQRNIRNNARLFRRELAGVSQAMLIRLAGFLILRCFLVVVAASDREAAYRIFSVMNDRGLDLSPTDILKAEILGEDDGQLTAIWEEIEDEVGRDDFTDLFAHIRMIHAKSKARASLTQEFRAAVPIKDARAFMDDLLAPLAEAYQWVRDSAYEAASHADHINRHLAHLNRLDNFDWMPSAMAFFQRHHAAPATLLAFTRDLERLAYGLFLRRANINDRIHRYAELLTAIEAGDDLHAPTSPLQLADKEKAEVLDFLAGPIYPFVKVRLPLLLRLDSLLADGGAAYDHKVVSIEHVLPQNPAPGGAWAAAFPSPEEMEHWVNRLANLVLLSRQKNSQAQNYDFVRKKNEYFQRKGVATFALTSQVLAQDAWTPAVLEARQKALIALLAKEWRLAPGPTGGV